MADLNTEDKGVESTSTSSSDSVVLTSEQRDEETIARLLGTDKTAAAGQDADKGDDDKADATATGEDEDSSTADGTADDKGEDGADEDLPEVTDEELEAIVDALDERLLTHPRLQKVIEDRAKADADRRYEERRKSESVSQESERLIGQGRKAVENVYNLFTKLNGNLDKAIKGEELTDADVRASRDELMNELGAFGAAAVAEARRDANTAFADAFREGATLGGSMTDEEKEKVVGIVQTAQRIANDPKQGSSASVAYLMQENVKFLVERAKAAGRAEAQAEFTKKRDALKKVVGENGTRAAVAKIANARKNLPTKPAATPAQESQGKATMEAYREAKAAGDYARADAIAAAMGQ